MKGGGGVGLVCAKTENRTFAGEGGGGSKNHPIYANVIIEWSPVGLALHTPVSGYIDFLGYKYQGGINSRRYK